MNAKVKIALFVLLAICAVLLWSSDNFDQHHQLALIEHESANLPMTFAHADHAKQQCIACHHNYQDGTGQGLCLDCHRTDQEIAFKMRDQFHALCMGCHIEKRAAGESGGPLRSCKDCHTADQRP